MLYNIPMSPKAGTQVIGYIRCSTQEQADSGAGLAAQRAAIEAAADAKGWVLVTILEDAGMSGKSTKNRPSLEAAMTLIEAGGADALVTAKLDRLSRSTVDFGILLQRAMDKGWSLAVLDMDLDMTTPVGRMVARTLVNFAEFEREIISQRTKDGLAAKRAEGVVMGRPRTMPDKVVARIKREHAAGKSLNAIAAGLDADAIPTAQGGAAWHASTVKAVLARK
jgi:DNA invertase Pin-like site-specific DNA recombinase